MAKKKNKGNANRAARRDNAAKERRVQRNTNPAVKMSPETLNKFGDALKKAGQAFVEKKKREQEGQIPTEQAGQTGGPRLGGALTKPDAQRILESQIEWVWDIGRGPADEGCEARVKAVFYKVTGNWMIQTGFPEGTGADLENFDSPTAQKFAEAILSAVVWENNWREFAGDYLTDQVEVYDSILTPNGNGGFNVYSGPGQDPRGIIMDEAKQIAMVPPSDGIGTWCPGGGQPMPAMFDPVNNNGKAQCGHCNRMIKMSKLGKLFPHKWEVK